MRLFNLTRLERRIKDLKQYVESLPLKPEDKTRIYHQVRIIRPRIFVAAQNSPINGAQIKKLNQLVRRAKAAHYFIYRDAGNLPGTEEYKCSKEKEVDDAWYSLLE